MSFSDYLADKKIDGPQFQQAEPAVYSEWAALFEQMHPDSFTVQKKFLINALRRRYMLRLSDD
ncbi:hypothetical protein [Spirosoma rhododendri]|uniref:Uncharacterized protein n=1 Tax=Spirosoma rhododendri TaxID=2728024 RepID=A0A7L5DUX3_9BACT|nr:hypothetical protein [Spirosoma rhododendri]QJD79360.1 hypothetical protein HH216_13755 [Spirosoma rhododendri]